MSKILRYENPLTLIGSYVLTGSNQWPTVICKDSDNGTREAWNMEVSLPVK